jgi:hypothetical protein
MRYPDLVQLLRAYENESTFLVGSEICDIYGSLIRLFKSVSEPLSDLARSTLSKLLSATPETDTTFRATLFRHLAFTAPDPSVISDLQAKFEAFKIDQASLNPGLIGVVLKVGARYCDGLSYLLELSTTASNPELYAESLRALGFAPADRLDEVLQAGLNGPIQEILRYWIGVAVNPVSGRRLFDFIKGCWDRIYETFAAVPFILPTIVEYASIALRSEEEYQEFVAFFESRPAPIAERAIQQAADDIRKRTQILARDASAMEELFSQSSK